MNADVFAEWLHRQGHRVIRTKSSYWYEAGPRVYQAFPYHWLIHPTEKELKQLMSDHKILALRYSTSLEAPAGMVSYHVILDGPYNLELLHHQARNGIRCGLKHFTIECISLDRMAEDGWLLQKDTLERQGRLSSMNQQEWQVICHSAKGLPSFEAWGAIADGELAASLLTTRVDDRIYVPYAQSQRKYLGKHVNNALFYTVCCEMLDRGGVTGIFFCLHSLDAPDSVNEFKFRMNFVAKPVRQRVLFHPWMMPITNPLTEAILVRLHRRYPKSNVISKAEGMLRFHLLGKRPLNQQDWPGCLSDYKETYFATARLPSTPPVEDIHPPENTGSGGEIVRPR